MKPMILTTQRSSINEKKHSAISTNGQGARVVVTTSDLTKVNVMKRKSGKNRLITGLTSSGTSMGLAAGSKTGRSLASGSDGAGGLNGSGAERRHSAYLAALQVAL